ncbi:ventrally-expressed-protein-D [Drosophila busckii]|uniref:Ventrally-expressed-protein-D n=1 Tax=Drosophila busckii TaxID=30019 RepID=A0A0M4EHS1_DROBS|nr:ventrally expressed gene D protein [Drosophila busckii]ALC40517.1 ventrally-expressed-protein-D [Drosophila busckii]
MIPQSEFAATAAVQTQLDVDYCEESRCNQPQTAVEIYHRILERLQRQSEQHHMDKTADQISEDLLKQIWIASFTGGNIYYAT